MSEISTVENQKIIIISKEAADKKHPYTVINLEAINRAAIELTTIGSYKLWNYLAKNQNNYQFALSRVDFCRWANVSRNTYLRAVEELEEKGFLVSKGPNSNIYTFYELPTENKTKTEDDKIIQIPEDKIQESKEFIF